MTGYATNDTIPNKITSLIENSIRTQVEAEVEPGIAEFQQLVKAGIAKLGVSVLTGPEYGLVDYVRKRRIEQLVDHRIHKLVRTLVPDEDTNPSNVHAAKPGLPEGADLTSARSVDASVPPGATLIIECDQALTAEQLAATEARALAKLPDGSQVLVLDRGLRASASISALVPGEGFTPAVQRTAAQDEQDAARKQPAGHTRGIDLVVRRCQLQDRIRAAVAAETKAFFDETGFNITSLDVQFVRQRFLDNRECHFVGSVDAGITLGQ